MRDIDIYKILMEHNVKLTTSEETAKLIGAIKDILIQQAKK